MNDNPSPTTGGVPQRPAIRRPVHWENDFSVHALDESPFRNRPSVADEPVGKFRHWPMHIPQTLMSDADLPGYIARDTFPIPCGADRENYMPDSDIGYWLSGLGDCLKVMQAAADQRVSIGSILDLGCASGRVSRHFCIQSRIPEVWGTDVNRRHIRWLCQYMPTNMKPCFIPAMPVLPLGDQSVDAVTAFSVFTHIDTFETAWLAEIRRVLRPGGMCYLTVHNEDTWRAMRNLDSSNRLVRSMIETGQFRMEMLDGPLPADRLVYRFAETGPYRSQVFHSNRYLERTWGRFFDIQDILPGHHDRQSVVLMTRPPQAVAGARKAA